MKLRRIIVLTVLFMALALAAAPLLQAAEPSMKGKERQIEEYIDSNKKTARIPGLSVVIVDRDGTVYKKGYGFANAGAEQPVTADTLFELGSTSKAFTALAVLQLEQQGLLNLDDPVDKYLPWLQMTYKGEPAKVTLSQLLHHTSGIPFKTIGDIPVSSSDDALEQTVRTLVGEKLEFMPGEKYLYATINYDVLGLIVQQLSGQSYETYMADNVIAPLGLKQTYLLSPPAGAPPMAQGYKLRMLRSTPYEAPVYRGNTPAGYIISNANDMERWLNIQLGVETDMQFDRQLIERSHMPDKTVAPAGDGSSYAAGWSIYQSGTGEISHSGSNPNFSSFIGFRPEDGIGVAVLANQDTPYTQLIGQGIIQLMTGKKLPESPGDIYKSMDNTASAIIFILIPVALLMVWQLGKAVLEIARGARRFAGSLYKTAVQTLILLLFVAGFAYCLYRIPDVIYWELNWSFVLAWTPQTLAVAVAGLFAVVLLFSLYYLLTTVFPKPADRSMFVLILLSVASGLGNAIIIFVVNETLARGRDNFQSGLLMYFILGIVIYVFGQKLVRTRLIHLTNNMVYQKRIELLDKILNTSYQRIDSMEYGRLQASLNNDTETISEFSNIVITGATSFVTLICCFVYMGVISVYGLVVAIAFIFIAAGLHFFMGKQANKLWEQTRDIQNVFFAFINDLIAGFKELSLHNGKKYAFKHDMQSSSETYREKRIQGDMKFANVNVIGELLFTFVIGGVAFVFPFLFSKLKDDSIRNYVFVLLYMTGPIHGILGAIPNIFKVKISWGRIQELSKELDAYAAGQAEALADAPAAALSLELQDVIYNYKHHETESFTVGPLSCAFRSGQITFITGGNGSGKSTMAKLITGLFAPDNGEIRLNGMPVAAERLRQQYSAIFSDFHLFRKLYGVDFASKQEEIERYLQTLHLEDKVRIQEGALSTIKLSTGQRKRLALLLSYLEDRPIYLFDEWAADQDPEFRQFFYETLLPELREQGKCIIAITHDDRYFGLADQVIKMEVGKIVASEVHQLSQAN